MTKFRQFRSVALVFVICFLAVCWIGDTSANISEEEKKPLVVSKVGQNLNPSLTYNDLNNTFAVAWIQISNIMNSPDRKIFAAKISETPDLLVDSTITVSKPSPQISAAPFVSVFHSTDEGKLMVFWQETENNQSTLILTILDDDFQFSRRAAEFAKDQGVLISPPVIMENGNGKNLTILWNEIRENKFRTTVTSFDPSRPTSPQNITIRLSESSKHLEFPFAMVNTGLQQFATYGYFANVNNGVVRNAYTVDFNVLTGKTAKRTVLVRKNIRDSLFLGATNRKKGNWLLVNLVDEQNISSLAVFRHDPDSNGSRNPLQVNSKNSVSHEGVILDRAFDDDFRIMWIEEVNGTYALKSGTLHNRFIDNSFELYQSKKPIQNLRAIYNGARTKVFLVWCEDHKDGGVRLKAMLVDL